MESVTGNQVTLPWGRLLTGVGCYWLIHSSQQFLPRSVTRHHITTVALEIDILRFLAIVVMLDRHQGVIASRRLQQPYQVVNYT